MFQKTCGLFFILVAAVLASGCEFIDTPNGKLPSVYLEEASRHQGVYNGEIFLEMVIPSGHKRQKRVHRSGHLPLQMRFVLIDDRPVLDLKISSSCRLKLGKLKGVGHSVGNKFYAKFGRGNSSCLKSAYGLHNFRSADVIVYFNQRSKRIRLKWSDVVLTNGNIRNIIGRF